MHRTRKVILAVMQPYLFPYIGYYQLAYHSDLFIFYDDVTYIKSGYINRNTILTKNGRQLFTLPVNKASSFTRINELEFNVNVSKVLMSITQAYSRAPYFAVIYPIIERILNSKNRNVSHMASRSVIEVFNYLKLDFSYKYSAEIKYDRSQDAKNKLYELCHLFNADYYVNAIGGQSLYNKDEFAEENITLQFITCQSSDYSQFNSKAFVGNLSVIDVLMNMAPENVKALLRMYDVK